MKTLTRILIILLLVLCHFQGTDVQVWTNALLYLVIAILFALSGVVSWKTNTLLKINVPEILIVLFIIYLIVNNALLGTLLGNERLLNYLIAFSLYFPFALLYKSDKGIINFIFYGIIAGLSLEILVGFGQLFGFVHNSNPQFVLGGLFGNPGAFAGYLAIVSSLLLASVIFSKDLFKSENFLYAAIFNICCAACLLVLGDSRGAWVAAFAGAFFVLNQKYKIVKSVISTLKSIISKWIAVFVLALSVLFICFALYQYKPDSAYGRLFIWKTSKTMILDNPISGNGFGFFKASYGKVQAHYFLNNNACEKEIQVADYVTLAYNEFLEILIESGILGLILFLSILYFALIKNKTRYHFAAKASLISLLILSMVSYPFRYMPNLLIMVICLMALLQPIKYGTYTITKYKKTVISFVLLGVFSILRLGCRQIYGQYHFDKGYQKVVSNNIDKGIGEYKKAYPAFKYNGEFLFYCGSAHYLKQDFSGCIKYLKKATSLSSEPNAFITLGNALKEEKRYQDAEQAYFMASGITPSKLYPKYLLAKLYVEMQQTEKAIEMAKHITETKEKVNTTAGMQIKEEMRKYITQYN